jgi:hypothetical protein
MEKVRYRQYKEGRRMEELWKMKKEIAKVREEKERRMREGEGEGVVP